jgi:hypothetical protein
LHRGVQLLQENANIQLTHIGNASEDYFFRLVLKGYPEYAKRYEYIHISKENSIIERAKHPQTVFIVAREPDTVNRLTQLLPQEYAKTLHTGADRVWLFTQKQNEAAILKLQ